VKVRFVYKRIPLQDSNTPFKERVGRLWEESSSSIAEAVQKFEGWLGHANTDGPRFDGETIMVPTSPRYSTDMFILLGGRDSIVGFLADHNNYSIQGVGPNGLALVIARKNFKLSTKKTLVGVCNAGWDTENPILKVTDLARGGFGYLDGTGKTLTFGKLGTFLNTRFDDNQV